jgi:protein-S-isoprenylcysteine O-methyltransferase Ste14
MPGLFALSGGVLFVASLLYFVFSYLGRFGDTAAGAPDERAAAIAIDLFLFSAFALHHSLFARLRVKQWIERHAAPDLERPIYVWIASLAFFLVCLWWQPVAGVAWSTSGLAAGVLLTIQLGGVVLTSVAAKQLDMLALAGVRPFIGDGKPETGHDAAPVLNRGLYGVVRHPIYLGWFLLVWFAPVMNGTRLAFAAISCAYLAIAIPFEERELVRVFGEAYGRYQKTVRWRMLPGLY